MKLKILLLTFTGITGCLQSTAADTESPELPKDIIEVSGSILDIDTKKPLKDVSVTAYLSSKKEKQVTTDEFGKFEFNEMKTGVYKVVFEKEGYRKVIKEKINIKEDEPVLFRIEMIESGDFDLVPTHFHFFNF